MPAEYRRLWKKFLALDSTNLSKWTDRCKRGEYNEEINSAVQILAKYLEDYFAAGGK